MAWAPDYVELERLRTFLGVTDSTDTADDTHLRVAISSASRAVDRTCHRQFGWVTESTTRSYTAEWSRTRGAYIVDIDDVYDDTGIVVASNGVTLTDYTIFPLNAPADGRPYTQILFRGSVEPWRSPLSVSTVVGGITVTTDKFGWQAFPDPIIEATQIQASRFAKRRDAPFGIAGSPDIGSEMRLLSRLDPDVQVLVEIYRRAWGAAR